VRESKESAGVSVRVDLVPDAFRYQMARGFEELGAGYAEKELGARLQGLFSKQKEFKDKVLFLVDISTSGGKEYHFLQNQVKDHLAVSAGTKKSFHGLWGGTDPRFVPWQVFEQRPDQKPRIYQKPLSQLKTMKFQVAFPVPKDGGKTPIVVSIRKLVRVTDNRDRQKTDFRIFESINVEKRQLSSSGWDDQIVSELTFTFYPAAGASPSLRGLRRSPRSAGTPGK
jgi:hypothetical protein